VCLIKNLIMAYLFFATTVVSADNASYFVFNDLSGTQHSLRQYRGKWIIINYWATWCPPCLEEMPELIALYDERGNKDVMVIGIVFDYESVEEVKRYMDDMLISYPIVLGNKAIVKQIGSAAVLPTTYIFNPQGKLINAKRGRVSRYDLETILQAK
jgi:thiol-disulfide isomerase/thioredoxin